jgi:lipoprotein-anchoring transpeptidase ErfK/SrfK
LLLATACSGGGKGDGVPAAGKEDTAAPQVTITPVDGTGKAKPEQGIEVKAANGTLETVAVQLKGQTVPGALSADKTSWKSSWTLTPNATYQVTATAKNAKKSTTASSKFKTLKASQTLSISSVMPNAGQRVGIGMPIVVNFNRSVTDRKAVERSLQVVSDQPAEGAWYWYGSQQAIFRTKKYWSPNQKIALTAHLAGVKSGSGTYGTSDFKLKFKIGDSHVSKVNVRTHRMTVSINGKKVKNVGISAGKGGVRKYTTTNGVHLTMEKENPVTMISPGIKEGEPGYYKEIVGYAVRISNSGEYVHSAPWSVGSQGNSNVSHGCVNASPAFASWFYNLAQWGDIVTITGTDRELEFDNGFGYWQKPWKQWVKGSAVDKSVSTDPSGTLPTTTPSTTPTAGAGTTAGTTPAVTPTP